MSEKHFILTLVSPDEGSVKKAAEKIKRWLIKFQTHLGLTEIHFREQEVKA